VLYTFQVIIIIIIIIIALTSDLSSRYGILSTLLVVQPEVSAFCGMPVLWGEDIQDVSKVVPWSYVYSTVSLQ
jgi:hypothetical protein